VQYVPTGVKGVDSLLDGKGIPRGYTILVLGAPGSGKTTFGLQFLKAGTEDGERGVYVSMDEQPEMLLANAESLGLGVKELVDSGAMTIIDASPIRVLPARLKLGVTEGGRREFALATLVTSITEAVDKTKATRIVVDPVSTLTVHFADDYERRVAFLDLLAAITKTHCTTLLLAELAEQSEFRRHHFEEFLAHGVMLLTRQRVEGSYTRVFNVEKMRAINHDSQPHPYTIAQGGIQVFPDEQVL
jgi:KaiC/GvpD/RAD55 family RecA-like ATPase